MFSLVTAVISSTVVDVIGEKRDTLISTLETYAKVVCVQPTEHMWILQGEWDSLKKAYAILEEFYHRVQATQTVQQVLDLEPGSSGITPGHEPPAAQQVAEGDDSAEAGTSDHQESQGIKFASPDSTASHYKQSKKGFQTYMYPQSDGALGDKLPEGADSDILPVSSDDSMLHSSHAEYAARTVLQHIESLTSSLESQQREDLVDGISDPSRHTAFSGTDNGDVISVSSDPNEQVEADAVSRFELPGPHASTSYEAKDDFDKVNRSSSADALLELQQGLSRGETGSVPPSLTSPGLLSLPSLHSPPLPSLDKKPDLTVNTISSTRNMWPPLLSYATAMSYAGTSPGVNYSSAYASSLLAIQQGIKQEPVTEASGRVAPPADIAPPLDPIPVTSPPKEIGGPDFQNVASMSGVEGLQDGAQEPRPSKSMQEYKCPVCGKTYKTVLRIREHIRTHNKDYVPVYHSCPKCGKSFTYRHNMIVHLRRFHFGVQPIKRHVCRMCGMKFVKPYMLRDHEVKMHQKDPGILKRYPCTQCNAVYSNKYALAGHCSKAHKLDVDDRHYEDPTYPQ